MTDYYHKANGGALDYSNRAWTLGERMVPTIADTSSNHGIAKAWVWEVTTAGTSTATPTWPASATKDVTTLTQGGATWTARQPGYSSGSTVNWTFATTHLQFAVRYAALNQADRVLSAGGITETLTTGSAITIIATIGVRIISVDSSATPPTAYLAGSKLDGSAISSFDIILQNGNWYGFEFLAGGGGAITAPIVINQATNTQAYFEDCIFRFAATGGSTILDIGEVGTGGSRARTRFRNCAVHWAGANNGVTLRGGDFESMNTDWCAGANVPNVLFKNNTCGTVNFYGDDFSDIAGTLFSASGQNYLATMSQCSLHASTSVYEAAASDASGEVFVDDCSDGDLHYKNAHYSWRGSTVVSTAIYLSATDHSTYDGTNKFSVLVSGNANATFENPYISPWFAGFHDGTSAITPRLEVVRDGSTSAYTNEELWMHVMAKTTSGSTRGTTLSTRRTPFTSAATVPDGVGLAGWTGESGTAKSMKLEPSSFTPAEIGDLKFRVCVAGNFSVYVSPEPLGV